ncbi:hypothetical protein LQ51_21290 [Micromonospora sp. HK10]|nr:hypothetical protein LQ51_21290 [Micromonospora sp. HK10]
MVANLLMQPAEAMSRMAVTRSDTKPATALTVSDGVSRRLRLGRAAAVDDQKRAGVGSSSRVGVCTGGLGASDTLTLGSV